MPEANGERWLGGLRHHRARASLFAAGAALVLILAAGVLRLAWPPGVPLLAGDRARPAAESLPPGSVVAAVTQETAVTSPFAVVASAASPSGCAAVVPEGEGRWAGGLGRAHLVLQVPEAGRFRLWLRCRWSDSCGNSLGAAVGDGPVLTVGQDAVYDRWHWVEAGEVEAAAGPLSLTLEEREDGVAVDQALLCPADSTFVPAGPIVEGTRQAFGVRRFADGFDRSPGHGNEAWRFAAGSWELTFSLDPNRIPLQYALSADPGGGGWAVAELAGPPWRGAAVRVSVYAGQPGAAAGVLFRAAEGAAAAVSGEGTFPEIPGAAVARTAAAPLVPGQWHRLEAERWGWSMRLLVDGAEAVRADGLPWAGAGALALLAAGSRVVFDDVEVEEIPWAGEDGADFRMAWEPGPDARWYRPRGDRAGWALYGRRGSLRPLLAEGRIVEIVLEAASGGRAWPQVPGWAAKEGNGIAVFSPCGADAPLPELVPGGICRLRRLSFRQDPPDAGADWYHLGPYAFSEESVPDIADYLDFTPDEYRRMAASPEAERLRRVAKEFPVVGSSADYAIWSIESGRWLVRDGVLRGAGRPAAVRFWQALNGAFRLSLKARLAAADGAVSLVLAEAQGTGVSLRLAGPGAQDTPGTFSSVISPREWHAVEVDLGEDSLAWRVDSAEPQKRTIRRGAGGGMLLRVEAGQAEFDDVLVSVPRRADRPQARCRFYAFDRREPDWWRRGRWVDHGGIACAVASSWISLDAHDGEGWLVHKESFPGDVLVAFNVEESTEWYGWDRDPSHEHYPADNIAVMLASDEALTHGYRLEVNSRGRRATVLMRDGVDVATVVQDDAFPIRYVGGHAPYRPRRNRIVLERSGGRLRAVINGAEVLAYDDPEPLPVRTVAVGGRQTRFNVSNLLVREPAPGVASGR